MNIIVFDTETTGLPDRKSDRPRAQPYICQFAAITLAADAAVKTLATIKETDMLLRPPVPIPAEASSVHGITNEMVADSPAFKQVVNEIIAEFRATTVAVAHNIEFDRDVIAAELERLGRPRDFLPPRTFDTMTATKGLCKIPAKNRKGFKNPRLQELHQHLFGTQFQNAHNAMGDVRATVECLRELFRRGVFAV